MDDDSPKWLKAMQNGALGEARAKAFLMDRFWILERSVDIDGADLIIQRRITSQNLLDKNPPKLGFVQVKFFESDRTTHYIPKVYVKDKIGNVRDEFFLLCFTGFEEHSLVFFLTSDMIASDFDVTIKSNFEKYRISGSKIFGKKYVVQSTANTLRRIERKLEFADFKRNREFISWKLPKSSSDSSAILPEYQEPLMNSWGHIPKEFQKIKKNALKAMDQLETIYLDLKEIAEETDPIEAYTKIEILNLELSSPTYGHWGREIMEDLYDENFFYTCKGHIDKVRALNEDGLLDNFMRTKEMLKLKVSTFLCSNLPIDPNTVHSMIIEFSLENFEIISLNQTLVKASEYFGVPEALNEFGHVDVPSSNYRGIKKISKNSFEYFWLAGRIYIDEKHKDKIDQFYKDTDFDIYRDCLDEMYESKYCD